MAYNVTESNPEKKQDKQPSEADQKRCCDCKQNKPLAEFAKNKRKKDGLHTECKPCNHAYRIAHRPERKIYDRVTRDQEAYMAGSKRWQATHRPQINAKIKAWQEKNHDRMLPSRKAKGFVQRAIWKGILVRPAECAKCGKACKPDAAHEDYSKPLEVRWLCKSCHVKWDRADPKTLRATA